MPACLPVCVSVYLSVCLSVYLSRYACMACRHVCIYADTHRYRRYARIYAVMKWMHLGMNAPRCFGLHVHPVGYSISIHANPVRYKLYTGTEARLCVTQFISPDALFLVRGKSLWHHRLSTSSKSPAAPVQSRSKSVTTGSRTEIKWEGRRLAINQYSQYRRSNYMSTKSWNQKRNWVCYEGRKFQPYILRVGSCLMESVGETGLLIIWWIWITCGVSQSPLKCSKMVHC